MRIGIVSTWYEVEYSNAGEEDWFSTGDHYDSKDRAFVGLTKTKINRRLHGLDYRVVKVQVTRKEVTA